jgi:transcription antitermination protein NusB
MGRRRRAREYALQILFQMEFETGGADEVLRMFWERDDPPSQPIREYAEWLVRTVLENRSDLDGFLQEASDNWRLSRMAVVDRNILRMAVCELLNAPDLVPAIVINEAIEIARKYSGDQAAVFVNGVLDAVRKKKDESDDSEKG